MRVRSILAAGAIVAIAAAGCGGGTSSSTSSGPATSGRTPVTGGSAAPAPVETESNPPGDIPDDTAFVPFRPSGGRYEVKVPEGWARTGLPTGAVFTDKLNSVRVEVAPASTPPTVRGARAEAPGIKAANLTVVKAESLQRKGGTAVRLVYRFDSAPDPVTGKVVRDEAERYEFFKAGQQAVVTLSGPVGADNVDPWRTVSDSFRWLR
ncbi:hypothetical protein ACFOY4_10040 [Actinomadura syzygii]|uniref:Lipoprotein n=1 Tax=Actinomadura syzygii TaxID=1427538 RepID=A0A5D0UDI9_9ACTN|nr:hypothetical protein [Actinomadura syzygii]TYC15846.1 hypothetical protein FXF65_10920 [Actinomadura syzygii]